MPDYTTVDMVVRSLIDDILRTNVPPPGTVAMGFYDDNGKLISIPMSDLVAPVAPAPATQVVDLLDLTGAQCDEVMALTYIDCDADPADSPAWSYPGMWFDAIDPATGGNYHYYCGRGTYVPGNAATGAGPAWHRVEKL